MSSMNGFDAQSWNDSEPRHADVARAAYAIFSLHGSQDGEDVRDWLDAEQHIQLEYGLTVHGRPTSVLGSSPPSP